MASPLEEIKIALKVTDANASSVVKKLESSFRGLASATKQLDAQGISKVRSGIKAFDTVGKRNINTIQSQITALRALRNEAQIGSSQFKQLTADIAKYDQELQKAQGRRRGGGRLVGAAKSVGAIAAAGVFGGPEGAIGSGIGALVGGPMGAAVGGAIGAQVGQFRQALGATAEYAANLQKLRIALEGVTTSQEQYQQGLDFIQQTTQDFAIPQEVVTRQFTKLQASVQGAGGNLDDTKTAFNGIVAAVRATGGSLADVDAALTATAQVFSKGKVSAEELRQQIGERLPGAFTLFAESMGITPAELDKALEQGKVSLKDFQGFAKAIFDRYGENAKAIADSPAAAGDRLKVSLEKLQENIGTLLGPVGAAFQKTFEQIVNAINTGITALTNFLGIGTEGAINKAQRELDSALKGYERYQGLTDEQIAKMDNRTKNRYMQSRRNVQVALAKLEAAKKNRSVVQVTQPTEGGGLPGSDPNDPSTKGTGSKIKDLTEAELNAALKQLTAKQKIAVLDKEAIQLKRAQFTAQRDAAIEAAKAANAAVNGLEPNKEALAIKKAEATFAQQNFQLDQQIEAAENRRLQRKQQEEALVLRAKLFVGEISQKEFDRTQTLQRFTDLLKTHPELYERIKQKLEETTTPLQSFKDGVKAIFEEAMNLEQNLATAGVQAVQQFGDAFANFVATGKANFSEMTRSILQDLARIFARAALFRALSAIPGVGGFLGLSAKGSVIGGKGGPPTTMPDAIALAAANGMAFAKNKIVPYAKGGIVSQPTLFRYASGGAGRFGLMGEAGPEAIMPLRRGPNGKLGVESSGAGMGNITVNVDASGSSVEGDSTQASQLGKMLGVAVQQELVKQKRPGGLLAS